MNSLIHHDPKEEEEKTYTPGEEERKREQDGRCGRKKFQMISDRIICDVGVKKYPAEIVLPYRT